MNDWRSMWWGNVFVDVEWLTTWRVSHVVAIDDERRRYEAAMLRFASIGEVLASYQSKQALKASSS